MVDHVPSRKNGQAMGWIFRTSHDDDLLVFIAYYDRSHLEE